MVSFELGACLITANAQAYLNQADVFEAFQRHSTGDWGELDEHDRQENEFSLKAGCRLLSAFTDRQGIKFWIITEADRSATTILLPEDY